MENEVDESWARFFTHKRWKYDYTVANKEAFFALSSELVNYLLPELVAICREYLAYGTYFTINFPRHLSFRA